MASIRQLEKLRPLGKLEQVSATCHHLGFFNNVGLSVHYRLSQLFPPITFDLCDLIHLAVGKVVQKYRILSAIPINEDTPDAHFASLLSVDLSRSIKFLTRSQPWNDLGEAEDRELDAILEDQHNTDFKTGYGTEPFWRIVVLQSAEQKMDFTVSFIYHHAIGDGVSGLVFHKNFHDALEVLSSTPAPCFRREETVVPKEDAKIPPALGQLHPLPINPAPPANATGSFNQWTGNCIQHPCKSRWTSLHLPPIVSKSFFLKCKQNGLSVTSVVSSTLATVLFDILPLDVGALTCIIPINLRPWLQLPREVGDDALGTYFDATRVLFKRPEQIPNNPHSVNDVWIAARKVSGIVNDYLSNVSPSGEPYTAVSALETIPNVSTIFKPMIGEPRDAAFEVTNVGIFPTRATPETNEASIWQVGKVVLSRSSLVTGAAVTVSVATGGDGSMTIGYSWQEGVVSDDLVEKINQLVGECLKEI
ncbi:hypothetical protein TRIATDRAFT_293585 [Trichoderma atroviride IMI 206040]|uniref:Alcohol acetyltransferase n=1 Tax=Hypocrea atroviridis (strain ATCC 20476 / IMI 206040) TaxID=452589 RepID=G9NY04_HYPAI|nr:uncharacterized protein TRIATDRAFT_293585 [Trichoderma atroviride IMI 206040]EHK44332.1 hypothetical protein TRIATDRAFT_293585 [Trichoderma atroviride IMI 206040]